MALATGMCGECSEDGYPGELCDLTGDITGCACGDMVDPVTGDRGIDPIGGEDDPDPFQWLWDAWKKAQEKREQKKKDKEKKDSGNSIAPWTEGPMFITDSVTELQLQGTLDELFPFVEVQ